MTCPYDGHNISPFHLTLRSIGTSICAKFSKGIPFMSPSGRNAKTLQVKIYLISVHHIVGDESLRQLHIQVG